MAWLEKKRNTQPSSIALLLLKKWVNPLAFHRDCCCCSSCRFSLLFILFRTCLCLGFRFLDCLCGRSGSLWTCLCCCIRGRRLWPLGLWLRLSCQLCNCTCTQTRTISTRYPPRLPRRCWVIEYTEKMKRGKQKYFCWLTVNGLLRKYWHQILKNQQSSSQLSPQGDQG